jgi:Ser/Thr protein kinase RdoA (MazF antagonist)
MRAPVHAMQGGVATPDWRPIDDTDLAVLVLHFPETLRGARIQWHSPRPFAASALLRSDAGEYFVKRHDPRVRDEAALLEEHAFLGHLREHHAPVPRVLRDIQGRGAIPTSLGVFEVHERMGGADLYRDAPSWEPVRGPVQARALGRMVARLHLAASGFDAPAREVRPLLAGFEISGAAQLGIALGEFLGERPALLGFLQAQGLLESLPPALWPWHEALLPHASELAGMWTHSDLHASNLLWAPDGSVAVAVFDFGLCNRTCALADLATAIERNAVAWLEQGKGAPIGRPELAGSIIAGYSEVLPLSSARRAALAAMLPLAHVEYAFSEVDYFFGVLRDEVRARLACPGFLMGHLEWFGGGEGREFLREVQG